MPRPSNTVQRRAEIIDALLTVMARTGYERATIAEIAKAADLSSGLVHYHFETKQEILVALVAHLTSGLEARIADEQGRDVDHRRRVHALIDAFVALGDGSDTRAVAAWVMIGAEAVRLPEVRRLYAASVHECIERLREAIGDWLQAEGRATRNAQRIAATLFVAIEGSYQIAVAAPGVLPVGFAAPMLRRMVDSLVAAEAET